MRLLDWMHASIELINLHADLGSGRNRAVSFGLEWLIQIKEKAELLHLGWDLIGLFS